MFKTKKMTRALATSWARDLSREGAEGLRELCVRVQGNDDFLFWSSLAILWASHVRDDLKSGDTKRAWQAARERDKAIRYANLYR